MAKTTETGPASLGATFHVHTLRSERRRAGRITSQRCSVPFEYSTTRWRIVGDVAASITQAVGPMPEPSIAGHSTHGCVSELAVGNRNSDFERDAAAALRGDF
jgi:hypothetical protein